jgi:type II secretory pathway component GspD/PulD (secretin)
LPLAHARAEKLASVLLDLWTPAPTGKPPSPGDLPVSRPRVAADPATNSLVLVASPEDLDTLRAVVEKLDQPERPAR